MKKYIVLALIQCFFLTPVVFAGQAADELGVCMADSLTGKERKNLAKWIFFSMSSHPEIKPYSSISEQNIDQSNRFVGNLITRLVTEDCPKKFKNAMNEGGQVAIQNAFGVVGQVAMQELMTNNDVTTSTMAFEKYIDKEKFKQLQ